MTGFIVIAVLMSFIAVAFVAYPLWRGGSETLCEAGKSACARLSAMREKAARLEESFADGVISEIEYENRRERLEEETLRAERSASLTPEAERPLKIAATLLSLCIPFAAVTTYEVFGQPKFTDSRYLSEARSAESARAVPAVIHESNLVKEKKSERRMTVKGNVRLDSSLKNLVKPGSVLFIYARPLTQGAMPVAVLRKKASDLPLDFILTDDMRPVTESGEMSDFESLAIGARISESGNLMLVGGDLYGESLFRPGVDGQPLKITIDRVLP